GLWQRSPSQHAALNALTIATAAYATLAYCIIASRRRTIAFDRAIHSGMTAPSRCRPPAHAADQAATAPSKMAVATEKARMMMLRRDRAMAVFALRITL